MSTTDIYNTLYIHINILRSLLGRYFMVSTNM